MINTHEFLRNIESVVEEIGYVNGDCGAFALALASLLGPKTNVVICDGEDGLIAHVAVEFDHRLYDCFGETTKAGLLSYCEGEGTIHKCPVSNLNERDILKNTNPAHSVEHFRKGLMEVWEQMQYQARVTEEHKEHLQAYGYEVVEEVQLGAYDLVLTYSQLMESYHIAMQRDGKDFADLTQQLSKYPDAVGARMSEAIPILNKWIEKYKTLWVAGNDSRKVRIYEKILKRLGYHTEAFDLMGNRLITVSSPSSKVPEPEEKIARYKLVKR